MRAIVRHIAQDGGENMVTQAFTPKQNTTQTSYARALVVVGDLIGSPLKSPLDEVSLTQRGIAPEAVDLLKELGVPASELNWIIKPRTLAHRKSKREGLTQMETGRWLRAAKIQALAIEVFADSEKARAWLQKQRKKFGGQSALDLIQSEAGAALVEDTLNQIDAGYFA